MIDLFVAIILSYFIGSFPTAILAGKFLKKIDIRDHGSGNAGATNVFRVLGWKAGVMVLAIDMFKGFAPVWWLVPAQGNTDLAALFQILIGIGAICGHIWTIFAGFKGGKGVGTAAGVFLALQPLPVVFSLITFLLIVSKTKYVSLGSMIAALLLPVFILIKKYLLHYEVSNIIIIVAVVFSFTDSIYAP